MPRFYPNTRFSDCWASFGNVTFYHRDGICYFRSKAYPEFAGTAEQLENMELHRRALRAWQGLEYQVQEEWRNNARCVAAHRPPFDNRNHISGYNLFVSAYHGFAQLGNEHVPEPREFVPFPVFSLDCIGCSGPGGSDITLRFRLTLCGTEKFSRYRVLCKVQLAEPGHGRNPGKMRNFLSPSVPSAAISEIALPVKDSRSVWGLSLDTYQLHLRYILLDSVTGYRSQYHSLSTLVRL